MLLGSNPNGTMFMILFDTKHRLIDISGFAGGNPHCYLHCFGIFYVHVQISKYNLGCNNIFGLR